MRAYFSLRPYGGRREEQSATFLRHRCGRDLACLPPAKRYTEEAMAAQEATEFVAFSNARMFNYVVSKEDVCQKLVERILGIEVDRIEFEAEEHSIQPGLQGHGVRLDVYARGGGKSFDVEMQAQTEFYIGCRLRYYQSVIDYDLLRKGMEYGDLPFSYIIFLCVKL